MIKKIKNGKKIILTTLTAWFVTLFTTTSAFANSDRKVNTTNAFGEAGISGTGDFSGVYNSLQGIVYAIMAIGGFWIIICLVWGGMALAASGKNPTKRTEGFIALGLTLIGAFIIFKAYDIAGWATGIGSATSIKK